MHRRTTTSRLASILRPTQRALTTVLAAGLICLASCGSDKEKTTPTAGDSNNATTAPDTSVVNSDKTSTDPTLAPLSSNYQAANGATVVPMPYVQFRTNPNDTNPAKTYSVNGSSYDTCTFGFRHGYTGFPTGKFDFVGFYLVNGTPGAPLAAGTYTAGSKTGMYIDTDVSGAGYGLVQCKTAEYPTVASGTVVITAVGTGKNGSGTTGTANVTMTDGSVVTGDFGTGTCVGGGSAAPVQPTPDPYTCSKLTGK